MSFHFPLLLPLVNANVCEILFFLLLYIELSASLCPSPSPLHQILSFIVYHCYVLGSLLPFHSRLLSKPLIPFPLFAFFIFSFLFLPAVQECALKTCFNLTNKKHWSQLAEEWRMEVEKYEKEKEKINKMLNGAQDEEEIFALTTKTSRFFITTNTKR